MLCQRRWKTQKIIICGDQVMHTGMLKCQEAREKLIAFCHKRSLINMITFAYFILLLIYCLSCESCDAPAPVPKGGIFITAHTGRKKLAEGFPSRPIRCEYVSMLAAALKEMVDMHSWIIFAEDEKRGNRYFEEMVLGCVNRSSSAFCASLTYQ